MPNGIDVCHSDVTKGCNMQISLRNLVKSQNPWSPFLSKAPFKVELENSITFFNSAF